MSLHLSDNASDWNISNNTASASFSVSGLEIVKTKPAAIDYIKVGEPFTYTIRVENNGSSSANSVVISDVFDPGLSVTGAKLTIGTTVTRFSSGNNLSRSIGTLPAGGVALLDVGVRGNSTVTQPITVTNMATVRASPSIVRTSNITDTGVVTITPAADFYVLNTDGVTSVNSRTAGYLYCHDPEYRQCHHTHQFPRHRHPGGIPGFFEFNLGTSGVHPHIYQL